MYSERSYYLAFSLVPRIGPQTFSKILSFFKTAERAWKATCDEYKEAGFTPLFYKKLDDFRTSFDLDTYLQKMQKNNVEFVSIIDTSYPNLLTYLSSPPIILFTKGNISLLQNKPILGVVGTRKVTSYGKSITDSLVTNLVSSYGYTIVSGLALGVDAIAHKAALNAQGNTIAVLGCGVNCCTPQENERLYDEILEHNGLIISEYPLSQQPTPGTFPARNRIIAGISEGILVTEAGVDSGSLITAHEAEALSRPIFAVPGPITSVQSQGTSQLLKQQATFVTDASDIVQVFGKKALYTKKNSFTGTADEMEIINSLNDESLTLDELSKHIKKPLHVLLPLISLMEIKGIIKKNTAGKLTASS